MAYFILTEESITAKEIVYKVIRILTANYRILEYFITNRDKLFTSKYWGIFLATLGIKKKLLTSFYLQTNR